jgi:hypothetical protein
MGADTFSNPYKFRAWHVVAALAVFDVALLATGTRILIGQDPPPRSAPLTGKTVEIGGVVVPVEATSLPYFLSCQYFNGRGTVTIVLSADYHDCPFIYSGR